MTAVDAACAAAGAAPRTVPAGGATAFVGASSGMEIPFLDDLREAAALSRLLGFAARPVRLRVKPGRSAIVAWRRDGVPGLAGWGWTTVMSDADKLANLRRRAERRGQSLYVHTVVTDPAASAVDDAAPAAHDTVSGRDRPAGAREFTLVSGGVLADPKLGASLARVRDDLDLDACTVVGYNPARRILLAHAGEFVRIGTDPYDRLLAAAEDWQRHGLPTLPVTRLGADATAVRLPWWGTGDLATHPDAQIAEAVGRTIAALHGRSVADSHDRHAVADACAMLDDTVRTLSRLLPDAEVARARRLARTIAAELSSTDPSRALTELSDIHGDLSPDQILIDGGDFRIIDLDRAGVGPVGMDLGRWIAACRLRGDTAGPGLEIGFLHGYSAVASDAAAASGVAAPMPASPPRIDGLDVWAAWALLLTAIEPWRTCRPDWRERTERHLDLAEEALRDRPHLTACGTRPSSSPIPARIRIDGTDVDIRRAWPAKKGRIAVEATTADGIRAGFLDPTPRDTPHPGSRDTPHGDTREASHGDTREPSPVDPRTATQTTAVATLLPAGADPDLPGLARLLDGPGTRGNRLVSHRPGRRAVVALADGTFAKCVRRGKAAAILAGQDRALAFAAGFILPRVLDADDATVLLARVPGVELHEPRALGTHWERAWTDCLGAWDRADAQALPDSMPTHTAEDEAGVLEDWRERADGLLGDRAAPLDALLDEVTTQLRDSAPPLRWGPVHRDLHDKQLMWDEAAGPGLLDVDTACRGERELDLGNLSAHATWRRAQGIWSPAEAEAVTRAIGRVASAGGCDRSRLRLYERASLLRLVCVYAFRPRWAARTHALLDAAAE
ncbi:aminoglycoside phosphotransferase family protein [Brevibacterium sp. 2SA]|uniref:aminoglycoside phosphotransferase family protein n=1 Tax=Brevibacterium sp. 2SA TaxID=2502198 RepID=UPI0010F8CD09|nr:aminoglycoside phosphotransferase family protein [Brevibacterium sp. 2SA]